ncbi:MAG: DUF2807 domain-containing protein [Defluviitaleaceae bacterium]|nr:DUF2807 domain-containing protein [Defluviitaleaceae bacterium]
MIKRGGYRMFSRRIIMITALVLALMTLSGCFVNLGQIGATIGNGQMVGGSFSFDGAITKIDVSGVPAALIVTTEQSSEVNYVIDENLKDLLEITYQNGVLTIGTRNNTAISSDRITFNISSDMLESLVINGAATITGNGVFDSETFSIEINGAGEATFALNSQNVSAVVNGASSITLSGTTEVLSINSAGASFVNTRDLIAVEAVVSLSGAGSVQVYAENTLDASIAGVGSVTYWGDPVLTQSAAGLASIRRGD